MEGIRAFSPVDIRHFYRRYWVAGDIMGWDDLNCAILLLHLMDVLFSVPNTISLLSLHN